VHEARLGHLAEKQATHDAIASRASLPNGGALVRELFQPGNEPGSPGSAPRRGGASSARAPRPPRPPSNRTPRTARAATARMLAESPHTEQRIATINRYFGFRKRGAGQLQTSDPAFV